MPKEKVKRGRRAQAKEASKKREFEDEEVLGVASSAKRRKVEVDDTPWSDDEKDDISYTALDEGHEGMEGVEAGGERPFYGLLDEQEQEYFKSADNMLENNQFANQDERALFLENVYKEAEGKELKLACSQSCSRLMERLIMLSTADQLKHLFSSFKGHFLHLIQHRFASHCCETLFSKSASVVTAEMLAPQGKKPEIDANPESMESLFNDVLSEIMTDLGFLMTDRFASHTFRVLLTVFSGHSLDASKTANGKPISRKRLNEDPIRAEKAKELSLEKTRIVPQSFEEAVQTMVEKAVAGLEPHYLRTLATHTNANLVLQQIIELELTRQKGEALKDEKSIIRRLLPEAPNFENNDSATFINGMLYDPIGSRLLEVIVTFAPAKLFKALWKDLFRDRFGALARNEISQYVMSTVLNRLSKEDLQVAHDALLEQIPGLAQRGRTAIIRTMVERCKVRGIDNNKLRDAILSCWAEEDGRTFSVCSMLDIPTELAEAKGQSPSLIKHHSSEPVNNSNPQTGPQDSPMIPPQASPAKSTNPQRTRRSSAPPTSTNSASILHRSLLAQTMLSTPGPLAEMLFTSLSNISSDICMHMALTSILSPVLQASLTVPHSNLIFRRKLITRFYSHIGALSLDPSGSHLVDAIWAGTHGMAFARERIAEELAENERSLRESSYGKKVWRNWKMDLYQRRRSQWVREMREMVGNEGFMSFPDGAGGDTHSRQSSARPGSSQHSNARSTNGHGHGHGQNRRSSGGHSLNHRERREMGRIHMQHQSPDSYSASTQNNGTAVGKPKTALDKARERHAAKKAAERQSDRAAEKHAAETSTGANAVGVRAT